MPRVTGLTIRNFRSIEADLHIKFASGIPAVLLGENNVGKSNVVRALDLLLGERWPGSWDPDDHDFYNRNRELQIEIRASLEDVGRERYGAWESITALVIRYPSDDDRVFRMEVNASTETGFVPNEVRDQCPCIVVGADRRLTYEMSYASKYTLLSRVMRRFHSALVRDPLRVDALKSGFKDVKDIFIEVPEFARFQAELQEQSDELVANLDYRLGIDFSAYDPSNFFHALQVVPTQGTNARSFDELGTGQAQMLALAFAYAYAKAFKGAESGLVLVIEEPEAHLHPLAQRWVARRIRVVASEGVQVVVTTHSPAFIDILGAEGMILLKKANGSTVATQLTASELATKCASMGAKTSAASILPFYAAASTETLLSGFFARRVVLVEGPTEALSLPVLLRRVGLDVEREGIAVLSCEGVGNLAKWFRIFTSYGIPAYVMFDNDVKDDADGTRRTDVLDAVGTSASDAGILLTSTSWEIEDRIGVFGQNYEEVMRTIFEPDYGVLEETAVSTVGLHSKPLIARYAAEGLPDASPGWDRIRELKTKVLSVEL